MSDEVICTCVTYVVGCVIGCGIIYGCWLFSEKLSETWGNGSPKK